MSSLAVTSIVKSIYIKEIKVYKCFQLGLDVWAVLDLPLDFIHKI